MSRKPALKPSTFNPVKDIADRFGWPADDARRSVLETIRTPSKRAAMWPRWIHMFYRMMADESLAPEDRAFFWLLTSMTFLPFIQLDGHAKINDALIEETVRAMRLHGSSLAEVGNDNARAIFVNLFDEDDKTIRARRKRLGMPPRKRGRKPKA